MGGHLKSCPSNFLVSVNTTVRAGMLRPMEKVSVAKRTFSRPSCPNEEIMSLTLVTKVSTSLPSIDKAGQGRARHEGMDAPSQGGSGYKRIRCTFLFLFITKYTILLYYNVLYVLLIES